MRALKRIAGAAFVGVALSVGASASEARAAQPPAWPAPDLVAGVRQLLTGFYGQRAAAGDPYYLRAPEWEMDKAAAKKDPDTLWEVHGGPGTACHTASSELDFYRCSGRRLARSVGRPYYGGASLFEPARGYYANEAVIQLAGYYALYHAFVHDFDAAVDAPYVPSPDPAIRNNKAYHRRMVQAYEAHMRDGLIRMIRDTRGDPNMQADLTRSAGALLHSYVRTVQAMQELDAWGLASDRDNALAVVAGLVQRIYWEWVVPQPEGPRTAGFAPLGSEATFNAAVGLDPSWSGTNGFFYDGVPVPSLRPQAWSTGVYGGLWFDADFALPGDWYCHARFASGSVEFEACLNQAARGGLGGSHSPFGQYYGLGGCGDRAPRGAVTAQNCGHTNLGSIAEEWLWTHAGARAGAYLLQEAGPLPPGNVNASARGIGARIYVELTARLGYGASGWHGAPSEHDDLEWARHPDGVPRAIRTLSAGVHDGEQQDGRFSVGETDTTPASAAIHGNSWSIDRQEFPGAMENHVPGPNALYGSLLFAYVLGDKVAAGLSGSLYDTTHRNNVGEFNGWVWLMLSNYYRCPFVPGSDDPADGTCFAFSPAHWPYPDEVRRRPLFDRADGTSAQAFRYLWRDPLSTIPASHVARPLSSCRPEAGVPWRAMYDRDSGTGAAYLLDEGGFGALNEQLQGYGGLMRLLAARYPLVAPDQAEAAEFDTVRDEVIAPWYNALHDEVAAILQLYGADYGYVPDIEGSACIGTDPRPASIDRIVLPWQSATMDSVSSSTVRRAMWYSVAALWYWQYDTAWLDVDGAAW